MIRQITIIAIGIALGITLLFVVGGLLSTAVLRDKWAAEDAELAELIKIENELKRDQGLQSRANKAMIKGDTKKYLEIMDSMWIDPPTKTKAAPKQGIVLPEWKDNGIYYRGYKEQGKEERVIK